MTVVFPVPGPPVMISNFFDAAATAAFCSAARWMPFFSAINVIASETAVSQAT